MKIAFAFLCFTFVLVSCAEKRPSASTQVLIDTDVAFSGYSLKHGIHKAFIEFAHDSMAILRDNQMPLVGKQTLVRSYVGKSDSGQVLTWKPAHAVIAQSGEIGYTYGFWTLIVRNDTLRGTYLTVWKMDKKGQWKFIADTGNQGLRQ